MLRLVIILFFSSWLIDNAHAANQDKALAQFNGKMPMVLFFVTHDCPVANKMVPEIKRIAKDYRQKAGFMLVYADPDMTLAQLKTHQTDFKLTKIPNTLDKNHQLVKATGAEVTPEAVIIKQSTVVYRGRINNFYENFGKPRRVITQHDLRDALEAVLAGRKVPAPRGECIGCYIPKLK